MGMLYELCPACGGTGTLSGVSPPPASRPCPGCKPLRVVETGATAKQLEASVSRAQRYEDALRELADAQEEASREQRRDPDVHPAAAFARLAKAVFAAREALRLKGKEAGG
jgi:DnaJ-class molecular chaperone